MNLHVVVWVEGGTLSIMQTHGGLTWASDWLAGTQIYAAIVLVGVFLTSRIRCFCWRGEGDKLFSSLHPELLSLHVITSCPSSIWSPCPPQLARRLTKVVNGQPKHVIGAHPRIASVLQDETLVETHNMVIISLQIHRHNSVTGGGGQVTEVRYLLSASHS